MAPERWHKIQAVFEAAKGLSPAERMSYLSRACADDPATRVEVEALLAQDSDQMPTMVIAGSAVGPGTSLGPYRLEMVLGAGGMGEVFRARDTRLGRPVAVKVIRAGRAQDAAFHIRFQREARATAALNHAHICTLYDVGDQDGTSYLVMEYVDGHTLASRLREGPLPMDQLLSRAMEVAQALAAAHERGIIHRDLKPANLMLTPAGVKVLDFGLAKFAGGDGLASDASGTHAVLGTPGYMSPEQARGEELDARSDIFSFGCVFYEAATGVRPFRGSSVPDILREVVSGHPPPPSSLRSELPTGWDVVLLRALAKDRTRRFASAADLIEELERLRGSAAASPSRVEAREPDKVFGRDHELQRLGGLLQSALGGSGRVVLVSGEPGIGKTSLTRNFVYQALRDNGALMLARGTCIEQYGTGEAYLPFLDAIDSLLQGGPRERVASILRRHAPTWCLQFPSVFSGTAMEHLLREATGATKDRMLRELGDTLGALTADAPLLLVLEDFHWSDPASVDMLRHLAERAHSQRLLIVATARPEDIERNNPSLKKCYTEMHARGVCDDIALRALAPKDIAAYLDAHFQPNDFPADLAAVIHRKSEGHPLFATGAIQLLAERGDITRSNGGWTLNLPVAQIEVDVPVTVRSMIEKKIALLDDAQRQTLQYASVEGEVFTSSVLAALLDADELELEDRLDVLRKVHRLIQQEGEEELPDGSIASVYRFTHALYQNFLYEQLLSKRRTLLHKRAGETLERIYSRQQASVAGALATHFERGRDFQKAVTYVIQAGETALSRYANNEAMNYFARGLELAEKLPEEVRLLRRPVLLQKRAQALTALGRLNDAMQDYLAMREACRRVGDLEGECRALIGISSVAQNGRDVESMERYNPEARALAEKIGDPKLIAEAYNAWSMYRMVSGDLQDAERHFSRSLPIARSHNHRPALVVNLTFSGIMQFWRSRYADAETLQVEAAQLAAEIRDGFHLPLSLFYLGLTQANRGRIGDAMRSMNEGLDLARRNSNALALSRIPNGIGWVWREIGDLGKAIEFNEGCAEVAQRARMAEAEANALLNLVYDYLHGGRPEKAADALDRIYPLYEREKWNRWRFYGIRHRAAQAEYWLAQGNLEKAEEHARALLANAHANNVAKYTATAHRLLGEIAARAGDLNTADEELALATDVFDAFPMPLIEWRHHVSVARVRALRQHTAGAQDSFQRAERLVRDLARGIHDPDVGALFLGSAAVREVLAGARGT